MLNNTQKDELEMLLELDRICKANNLEYYLAYGSVLGAVRHGGFIPWDTDIDIMVKIDNYKKFCEIVSKNLIEKYELKSYWENPEYESLLTRLTITNKPHNLIHIDIFPLVGASKNKLVRKIEKKISFIVFRLYFIKKVNVNSYYHAETKKTRTIKLLKILIKIIPERLLILIFEKIANRHQISDADYIYNICGSYGKKEFIPKEWLGKPKYFDFESSKFPVPKEWDKYLTHIYGDYMTPKKENYV